MRVMMAENDMGTLTLEENDTQDTDNDDRILIPQIHPT